MHPHTLQALVATRITEMSREAEAAHLAGGVRQAGPRARRRERMLSARRVLLAARLPDLP
ncbi:MAG: hypothetical protein ACRDN0_19440 [Trebonia sp.]